MDGLKVEKTNVVEGNQQRTAKGDNIAMHYRGRFASTGKEFDASYNRGKPLSFKLGTGMVIQGYAYLSP